MQLDDCSTGLGARPALDSSLKRRHANVVFCFKTPPKRLKPPEGLNVGGAAAARDASAGQDGSGQSARLLIDWCNYSLKENF